jgi:hypothetical protein
MTLVHLPSKMRRSTKSTRTQPRQRGTSSSAKARIRRPSPPDLMEDDEEERVAQAAIARGEETVCTFILTCH